MSQIAHHMLQQEPYHQPLPHSTFVSLNLRLWFMFHGETHEKHRKTK